MTPWLLEKLKHELGPPYYVINSGLYGLIKDKLAVFRRSLLKIFY